MKKITALVLAVLMLASLGACANDNGGASDVEAMDLLTTVWNSYPADDKFAAAGGDTSEENSAEDAPGVYSIENADELDRMLGFPAAEVAKLDSAASLMHMMNANTFTCGAYNVKDGEDMAALSEALKDNILARQWMCGFPDRLMVAYVGNCLIGAFGGTDQMDVFKAQLEASYSDVVIVSEAPIA